MRDTGKIMAYNVTAIIILGGINIFVFLQTPFNIILCWATAFVSGILFTIIAIFSITQMEDH